MAGTDAPGVTTGKPLIESDRVEGTAVYDRNGNRIGSVKRLMIDKKTGQVAYTVLSFGGFLGLGSEEHTIPWRKLDYDTSLGGFRTAITPKTRFVMLPASTVSATTIGRTGSESGNFTTTGTPPTTSNLCFEGAK